MAALLKQYWYAALAVAAGIALLTWYLTRPLPPSGTLTRKQEKQAKAAVVAKHQEAIADTVAAHKAGVAGRAAYAKGMKARAQAIQLHIAARHATFRTAADTSASRLQKLLTDYADQGGSKNNP